MPSWYVHIGKDRILMPSLADDKLIGHGTYLGGIPRKCYEDIVDKIKEISTPRTSSELIGFEDCYFIPWPEAHNLLSLTHDDLLAYLKGLIEEDKPEEISRINFDELWEE